MGVPLGEVRQGGDKRIDEIGDLEILWDSIHKKMVSGLKSHFLWILWDFQIDSIQKNCDFNRFHGI